jgi:hypothetical protein
MKYKAIKLADKVSHEKKDIELYRMFSKHTIFNLSENNNPSYSELFLFFMSIGIFYNKTKHIENRWNNIDIKNINEKYIYLITSLSYAENGDENIANSTSIAKEAEAYANGGLHYLNKLLEDEGSNDNFIKKITLDIMDAFEEEDD